MTKTPAVPETAFQAAGAVVSPTSLDLTNPELEWRQYKDLAALIGEINRSCAWWVGDLIVQGEKIFGDAEVANIDEVLGLAPQTIANRASVAKHIPPSKRRAGIAFGTHAEVAYLPPKERDEWLDRAEEGGWTRAILRLNMRLAKGESEEVAIVSVTGKNGDQEGSPEGTPPGAPADVLGEPVPPHTHTCPSCGHRFKENDW